MTTHFDKWMYVFTHLSQLNDRPKRLQDRIFTKLFKAAEIAKFTPKEREAYEESLKYYRDIKNVVDTSREEGFVEGREEGFTEGREEGFTEGREEGFVDGMERGMERGMEKGMEKGVEKTAKKMKAEGFTIQQIKKITGLTEEEIKKL